MSGFVAMIRDWQDHDIFDGDEFSRRDAWAWLIAQAAWKATRVRTKGVIILLERGQLCYSVRFLAQKWGWSKSRVDRFLALLRDEGMIEKSGTAAGQSAGHDAGQSAGHGEHVITICNYGKYQTSANEGRDSERANGGTVTPAFAGQERDKEEQRKQESTIPNGMADPTKLLFDLAIDVFGEAGKKPVAARSIIGGMRKGKDRDAELIALLMECKANRKGDPVAFVTGGLKHRAAAKPEPGSEDDKAAFRRRVSDDLRREAEWRERQGGSPLKSIDENRAAGSAAL